MKQCIVVTYKNGSSINIDVPELYYEDKYRNNPKKTHTVFLKQYTKFVKALNKDTNNVVSVGKYLKFSNATVSGRDVLCVDIKILEEEIKPQDNTIFIPGVHDRVYLDLTDTRLDRFLERLETLNTLETADKLMQKLLSYFNKSNLEFTIKSAKKTTTTRKKKTDVEESAAVIPEAK